MAILAALFAFGSRFAGKILTTALGWASTLLFGRVPADRQPILLGITFGSVIWLVLLGGVLFPDVGTFLLVLVPPQDFVPEWVIRVAMLIAALIVPAVVGVLTVLLRPAADRTPRTFAEGVARGYPLTVLLAVLLVFLAGLALWRRATSLARGWTDAHVPIVVTAGAYEQVADDLDRAVTAAGLEVTPRTAPAVMSTPARWLATVAGRGSAGLVPDRLIQLDGKDLDILIYPMDLLISGRPQLVNRARAAMASRLTTSAAHLTISAEGQAVEDRLTRLARPPADDPSARPRFDDAASTALAAIDDTLATIEVPYEEWEVLYRQRLQVERDLRAGAMAEESVLGSDGVPTDGGMPATLERVGRWLRAGADVVLDVAADQRTGEAIDRLAGSEWRWAARAATVVTDAARDLSRDGPGADTGAEAGEPLARERPAARPDDRAD
jgi:hypothetical protein